MRPNDPRAAAPAPEPAAARAPEPAPASSAPRPFAPPAAAPAAGGAASPALLGLLLVQLIVGTINGISRVALPLYAAHLGAHSWQVGVVGGFGYLGMLTMAVPMGAWIDRHGARPLFAGGVVVAAIGYLLLPSWPAVWFAILGSWLLGLVLPFRTVPVHTEFLAMLPQLGPAKAGWNRAAQSSGMFFIGPSVAAAVIAAAGFSAVFYLAAAGLAVVFFIGRRVLQARQTGQDHAPKASLLALMRSQAELVRAEPVLRRNMWIDALAQMAMGYFVVFGVLLAVRQFGMTVQGAAALVTVQGVLLLGTSILGGLLLARLPQERRFLLAFGLFCAAMALMGLSPKPGLLWPAAALLGAAVGIQGLASVTRYARLMQRFGRGRIGAMFSLAGPAGGILGTVGGGVVGQQLGLAAGFQILAVVYAVLFVAQWQRVRRLGDADRTDA